jgi:hypothetical protein
MTTKMRLILYDLLGILYFVFLIGWVFAVFNLIIFLFVTALFSLLSLFIRPNQYDLGKTRRVILILIFSIMVISCIVAICIGVKSSWDDSLCPLLPTWFKLIFGCCLAANTVVVLSKLLQDLKIGQKME